MAEIWFRHASIQPVLDPTCRFAPVADKEQVPDTDTEKGMRLAVGQIDALLATVTRS